ncbi:MAG: hypothetical protein IT210_10875 [Armatimonadetes bacterium]|nr:hypothetical protein [Armatimonadota bacterium]
MAAHIYGNRVIGVILSGSLDDGSSGPRAIWKHSGPTVAQTPEDAAFPGMPRNAITNVGVDHIAPAAEIASLLAHLVRQPLQTETPTMTDEIDNSRFAHFQGSC